MYHLYTTHSSIFHSGRAIDVLQSVCRSRSCRRATFMLTPADSQGTDRLSLAYLDLFICVKIYAFIVKWTGCIWLRLPSFGRRWFCLRRNPFSEYHMHVRLWIIWGSQCFSVPLRVDCRLFSQPIKIQPADGTKRTRRKKINVKPTDNTQNEHDGM